jgi:hypothetical protein
MSASGTWRNTVSEVLKVERIVLVEFRVGKEYCF